MKYAPLLVALLVGCSTTAHKEANIERARAAIMHFQALCMAAEHSNEYRYGCVKAKYDLCREAFRQHHEVWFSENVRGRRDKDGSPTDILDMNHEMFLNGCNPELE